MLLFPIIAVQIAWSRLKALRYGGEEYCFRDDYLVIHSKDGTERRITRDDIRKIEVRSKTSLPSFKDRSARELLQRGYLDRKIILELGEDAPEEIYVDGLCEKESFVETFLKWLES
ncbi:MAG: hypothetical protein KDK27_09450 [Leptospiraceae bacterium]|nr:hypothetical protein [Leptospiraceae bacterium]